MNEKLGTADPFIQILFAGLWCLADKEGRLEDRPLRIKAEILPYREGLDINGYLTVLSRLGFIQRYQVEGKGYIEVLHFKEHQNPHHTEKSSVIPASSEGTVISPLDTGENPADSLIPDSLIPDSLIPDVPIKTVDAHEHIPYQEILNSYNKFCPSLPRAHEVNSMRHLLIKAAYEKYSKHDGGPLKVFDTVFKKAEKSNFLKGLVAGKEGKGFRAKFDWIFDLNKMAKILEGDYDDQDVIPVTGSKSREEELAYLKREGLI